MKKTAGNSSPKKNHRAVKEEINVEFEVLVNTLVCIECKIDALTNLLDQKGIIITKEELKKEYISLTEKTFDTKREVIHQMLAQSKFVVETINSSI